MLPAGRDGRPSGVPAATGFARTFGTLASAPFRTALPIDVRAYPLNARAASIASGANRLRKSSGDHSLSEPAMWTAPRGRSGPATTAALSTTSPISAS